MQESGSSGKNKLYRKIPRVDALLENDRIRTACEEYGRDCVRNAVHAELDALRRQISGDENEETLQLAISAVPDHILARVQGMHTPSLRKVINATGTILHTNLGRAPISREQVEKIMQVMTGYSNLEYDLEKGVRGERYAHFEDLLCRITGAEAAMAVNNNAAAVMLMLDTLAKGGEVIVSRGELVEIGGNFRIPDVMKKSGAVLAEVGTTNKTHLYDYENAVTEDTKMMMKVHTSNYSIVGFTQNVTVQQLRPLADRCGIPLVEDLGSGILIDLEDYGLPHEPTVQDALRQGADVVCFSADKLLGGPQAGIILGKKKYIDLMKKNQLTRALRIDKFTVAALELVLMEYQSPGKAVEHIPVLRMLTRKQEEERKRAGKLASLLREECSTLPAAVRLRDCKSKVGGGSMPLAQIPGAAVVLEPHKMSADEFGQKMMHFPVPVIARIFEDAIWMDVRTIDDDDFEIIVKMFRENLP